MFVCVCVCVTVICCVCVCVCAVGGCSELDWDFHWADREWVYDVFDSYV